MILQVARRVVPAASLACVLSGILGPTRPEDPACPPVVAEVWINHIGQPPTLESLRGRPVLLGELRKATLHELIDLQDKYESRGLVVLAVSRSTYDSGRVDTDALYAVPFPIGFGSETESELEELVETRFASAYLIDRDGRVVWAGLPHDLPDKELKALVRAGPRPDDKDCIAWRGNVPDADPEALALAADGELARALERTSGTANGRALRSVLTQHIEDLAAQIDTAITERRALALAVAALEVLRKQLEERPEGLQVRKLSSRVSADRTLTNEIDAHESLLELIDFDVWRGYGGVSDRNGTLIFKKSYPPISKTKETQLVRLVKKHDGTRAAERAELLLEQLD